MEKGSERSGDENENESGDTEATWNSQRRRNTKNVTRRHTSQQIQQLEEFFKNCQHPSSGQKKHLSELLGLDLHQIQFWFQNRRTYMKNLNEKAEINQLRQENKRLYNENLALKQETEKLKKQLANRSLPLESGPVTNILEEEMSMIKTMKNAVNEVLELLKMNAPIWIRSPCDPDIYTLHRESYNQIFPKMNQFKSITSRFESSRDSVVVPINAMDLVSLFMNPASWVDLFPTIVTKANTLKIVDDEHFGSLHVMYKQMHILSPLVAPREFLFLRKWHRIDSSSWVIVDVSHDTQMHRETHPTRCWQLPSGCMIHQLANGNAKVTWVEHIEVDDKALTHNLFRDSTSQAYGAKLWLSTLARICERFAYSGVLRQMKQQEVRGVIDLTEGRRSIMMLSNKMVKSFCAMLTKLFDKIDHLREPTDVNSSGVRVSIHHDSMQATDHPLDGMIFTGVGSFWLPLPCQTLFSFLTKKEMRPQWDLLSNEKSVNEIEHISCGSRPLNYISVLKPVGDHQDQNMLILQESIMDSSGAYVIYSPMGMQSLAIAKSRGDTEKISLLPSGFSISSTDGNRIQEIGRSSSSSMIPQSLSGSLLTVALQIHVPRITVPEDKLSHESVAMIYNLINSIVQRIKEAFHV